MAKIIPGACALYGHPSVGRFGERHNYLRFQMRVLLRDGMPADAIRRLLAPYLHVSDIPGDEIYKVNVAFENVRIARAGVK